MFRLPLIAVMLTTGLLSPPTPAVAQEVTIYRCVGKGGALTLRDSPCVKGQEQEVLNMQRPKDPPAGRDARRRAAGGQQMGPVREVQVIYRTQPQTMYECVDESGRRYTSADGLGNRRWVPLWTLGYPVWQQRSPGVIRYSQAPDAPVPSGVIPAQRPDYAGVVTAGGTWVSDECYPLPREAVCERLSDRHYEIIRLYNTAGPTERRQLDMEQRSVDARLATECGIN